MYLSLSKTKNSPALIFQGVAFPSQTHVKNHGIAYLRPPPQSKKKIIK